MDSEIFQGRVVWLTAEQGGRSSGPPTVDEYRVTAFVPPYTVDTGLASFFLASFEPGAWLSPATAWWPFVANVGAQQARPGSVVVITEGRKTVAYFHVDEIGAADT